MRISPLVFALLCFSACPGELENPERFLNGADAGGGPTCNVENGTFKNVCATAGCHDAVTKTQFLDLESPGVLGRIKAQQATCASVAGQPLGTFLIAKINGTSTCGAPMPSGFDPLDAGEIRCIEAYIADGGLP
jgi:hypothetical protein